MLDLFQDVSYIPVGYVTPKFPALHWPELSKGYKTAYLYYILDMWKFTSYWCLIINFALYSVAGALACLSHRDKPRAIFILGAYLLYGGVMGIIYGTVIGFLIATLYRSGQFAMTTWIPFCTSIAMALYEVVHSYSVGGSAM